MGCSGSAAAKASMAIKARPLVTITGVTGYLGGVVAMKFLEDGGYRVRGTVRSTKNEAKMEALREGFGKMFDKMEIVEADLMNAESIESAIRGSRYVAHVASPFLWSDKAEDFAAAVSGTIAVMKACHVCKVKRCVVTSSLAAVTDVADQDWPANGIFTDRHWTNPDRPQGTSEYYKSKTLAERAAWDFVEKLPIEDQFELVTVLPGFIMGPPMTKTSQGVSINFVKDLMEGKMKQVSNKYIQGSDVDDVALAHVFSMKKDAVIGRRVIVTTRTPSMHEYAQPLSDKFKPLGWPITDSYEPLETNIRINKFDTSLSQELGIEYRDWSQTMVAMADRMIELGIVKKP